MFNNLVKSLLTMLAFLMSAGTFSASAQRTMSGQTYSAPSILWNGQSLGAEALIGNYTLNGYWEAGVRAVDYDSNSNIGLNVDYAQVCACGGYLFRLVANKSRSVNVYGGAGAFAGIEVVDQWGALPSYITTGELGNSFLYGMYGRLLFELFVFKTVAVSFVGTLPLGVNSQFGMLKWDVGLGCRFML